MWPLKLLHSRAYPTIFCALDCRSGSRSTSLGLSSCRTQYPCFCIISIALRRFEIACWVTPKILVSFFEFGMNLDPIMPQTQRLHTLLASLRVLCHCCRNRLRRNQYSYVFIDISCSPYASHCNQCPSAALFFKLKQKTALSVNAVLLAQKLTSQPRSATT